MTTKKERAERVPADRIVKRSRDAQKLPANLEAFARGDDDALWRRDVRGGKVNDPRMIALIPGLKNSDARMVYEDLVASPNENPFMDASRLSLAVLFRDGAII